MAEDVLFSRTGTHEVRARTTWTVKYHSRGGLEKFPCCAMIIISSSTLQRRCCNDGARDHECRYPLLFHQISYGVRFALWPVEYSPGIASCQPHPGVQPDSFSFVLYGSCLGADGHSKQIREQACLREEGSRPIYPIVVFV